MDKMTKDIEFREVLLTFLLVVIAVVSVFGVQILLQLKSDLTDLKSKTLSTQAQLVSQRNPEPFRVLNENCTQCHNERRFTRAHADSELSDAIPRIEALPDF